MSGIKLKIDGKEVEAQAGDTILDAAKNAGIDIPTLCAHPSLEPYGACRLCIVKVEGMRGYPTSCTTPVADGMNVNTTNEDIIQLRRNILKLLLSGHTSPCVVCLHKDLCEKYRPTPTKAGRTTRCGTCSNREDCSLKGYSDEYEIKDLEVPVIYNNIPVERDDPFMDRDYSLCILCGRCVRICKKLHDGKGAIDFIGRGKDARIGTVFGKDHTDTNCQFCGACVDICPTGALTDRYAKWLGTPDEVVRTTCMLCPEGCLIDLKVKNGQVIGAQATDLTVDARVCAIGRFVLPQLFENPSRLRKHMIRVVDGDRKVSYEETVEHAAEKLKSFSGEAFAMIAHPSTTREDIYLMRKFTKEAMKSDNFCVVKIDKATTLVDDTIVNGIESGKIKAAFTTGDYLGKELLDKLEVLIVADMFPSKATEQADAVFAAGALAETSGTFITKAGEAREINVCAKLPDGIYPDWKIISDVAAKMGASGVAVKSSEEITKELPESQVAKSVNEGSPIEDLALLPRIYRGHKFEDIVCALKALVIKEEPVEEETRETGEEKRFKILEKQELVPDTHMLKVYAPAVAENCKPGQFVIAMVNEFSERIPYTVADWDKDEGTVTINVLEAGRSSREVALLKEGDHLAHFAGPLGKEIDVKKYGTVVLGGGCYGVGGIYPLAKELKKAGNRVICVIEAASHYLLYWEKKLKDACDELVITTKDGSRDIKGGVQEGVEMLVGRGEKIDQSFIIGCTFMMMLVCEETKKHSIPTLTAMNPLMLDGTGMCGACRVTMGEEVKFACVDGPFLDGLQIDWKELMQRHSAFRSEEIESLPQEHSKHKHLCRTI